MMSGPALRHQIVSATSVALLIAAFAVGAGLRMVRLDQSPPGLNQDEACNGYDAYSIYSTGRDQHGNFLPLAIQGFNDYRMPLFDYSLVPLVGALGLKSATVRLGAAIWGLVDIGAIAILAGLILGWPGAAIAVLLAAMSPWHLPFSRFAEEPITASATIDLAMACFFLWLIRRRSHWLMLSALFFGLSLYSYSITKLFTPLMIGLLGLLYWRDLRGSWKAALGAIAIVALFAMPQALMFLRHPAQMQARFRQISVFSVHAPLIARLGLFASGFASHFRPSFLFFAGDNSLTLHPRGFGQLLPEQMLLVTIALIAMLGRRRQKLGILLIGWLLLAALPGAMLWNAPHSQHDVLAFTPWLLLSALGFVALLEFDSVPPIFRAGAVAIIVGATIVHGVRFARVYFDDYPVMAERDYAYGMDQVVHTVESLNVDGAKPIVITDAINQPYIYVLFYKPEPPSLFQGGLLDQQPGLFGNVLRFEQFWFFDPAQAYPQFDHAILVYPASETLPAPAAATVRYPDGSAAYNIVVK